MKKNTKRAILAFVISLLVTLVALLAYAYFKGGKPVDDGNQQSGENSEQEDEPKNENGASFEYAGNATIYYDTKLIELYFKNPLRSTRDIVLEVKCDVNGEEVTFAKTEQMKPGEEVKQLPLLSDVALSKGKRAGEFVLHFYNSEGQEEIVNSKININLFVK